MPVVGIALEEVAAQALRELADGALDTAKRALEAVRVVLRLVRERRQQQRGVLAQPLHELEEHHVVVDVLPRDDLDVQAHVVGAQLIAHARALGLLRDA